MENFRLAIYEPDIHSLPNLKTATTTTTTINSSTVCVCVSCVCVGGHRGDLARERARWWRAGLCN